MGAADAARKRVACWNEAMAAWALFGDVEA